MEVDLGKELLQELKILEVEKVQEEFTQKLVDFL